MKKLIALALVLAMALSLSACGLPSVEDLCGTWAMDLPQDADTAETMLTNMEFYPEEIALIDLENLDFVMIVEFNEDKTYRFAFDVEATKANIRRFYADAIEALYNGRESLVETYGDEIKDMTLEEFQQAYAEMFSMSGVDSLLDYFVDNCADYSILAEDLENGTFRLLGKSILCKVEGSTEEEKMDFEVDGDTLTLIYVDGEEVYTKQK